MAVPTFELRVADVIDESPDTRSFVLDTPVEAAERFAWKAGQFLTFHVPWSDFTVQRSYSISTSREAGEPLRVTVRRVEGGRVSNWMNDEVRPGDLLTATAPDGRFVLADDTPDDTPLLLLGGGSGLTPILALLKTALRTTARPIFLLDAHRDEALALFGGEIDAEIQAHPDRVTRHRHLDTDGGFLTAEAIRELLAPYAHGEAFICGPGPFMDLVEEALTALEVPAARQHFERFVSPVDPDRRTPTSATAPEAVEGLPTSFEVEVDGQTRAIPLHPDKSLLDCALDAGVDAPHSCTEGFCGCCMATLVSGEVVMDQQEALTRQDRAQRRILMCQARPSAPGPLKVVLEGASFGPAGGGSGAGVTASPEGGATAVVVGLAMLLFIASALWFFVL